MKTYKGLFWFGACVMLLSGCLTKARTPYNEVALFSEEAPAVQEGKLDPQELDALPGKTVNAWPFYIGDGRAHYFAWPFIKKSPGCFAILPLYNYDHGIHDIALICTLSPESGEYRLWPIFYRSPKWWMLLPLAYAHEEGYGCPLLFNVNEDFNSVLTFFWNEDGWFLFPLAYYGSDEDGDYAFNSLLYGQEYRTYGDNTVRDFHALLWLFNTEIATNSKDNSREVSQRFFPFWFRGYYDPDGKGKSRWHNTVFPLYWSWGRETGATPDSNHLFIPFYYKHSFGDGGSFLCTPLAGYGKTPQQDASWWYVLNVGAAESDIEREYWGGYVYDEKGERLRSWYKRYRIHERSKWALPFWFDYEKEGKEKNTWTLFSYAERDKDSTSLNIGPLGIPFPFSMERRAGKKETFVFPVTHEASWYTTSARTGEKERYAPSVNAWRVLGGLLWEKRQQWRLPKGALPVNLHRETWQTEGSSWSIPLLRLGREDWKTWEYNRLITERTERGYGLLTTYDKTRVFTGTNKKLGQPSGTTTHEWGYSALLSSCDKAMYTNHDKPHLSYESTDRGFLLNTLHWGSSTKGDRNFSLGWHLLTHYDKYIWDKEEQYGRSDFDLLPLGILLDVNSRDDDDSSSADTSLLWGLLYNYERRTNYLDTSSCWKAEHAKECTNTSCTPEHHDVNCVKTSRAFHLKHNLLLGPLWSHSIHDYQEWHAPKGTARPELGKPTEDNYVNEMQALLTLGYVRKTQRDGSYVAKSLWGLLYDHTEMVTAKTETLGVLGYLYRYNRYADGSTSRTLFPFITYEDNVPEETTSISFLYKLFRSEKTPTGRNVWLFWIPVWSAD